MILTDFIVRHWADLAFIAMPFAPGFRKRQGGGASGSPIGLLLTLTYP
jgi:hypothetical protein